MLAIAALAAIAVQPPPQGAAELLAGLSVVSCISSLSGSATSADYMRSVGRAAARSREESARVGESVALSADAGACVVRYSGLKSDEAWRFMSDFSFQRSNSECRVEAPDVDHRMLYCQAGSMPAYDEAVARTRKGDPETVAAFVTFRAPAIRPAKPLLLGPQRDQP